MNRFKLRVIDEGRLGEGVGRISRGYMSRLGIDEGDPLKIQSTRKTKYAAVAPLKELYGEDVIELDVVIIENLGVMEKDFVYVSKTRAKPAEKVKFRLNNSLKSTFEEYEGVLNRMVAYGKHPFYASRNDLVMPPPIHSTGERLRFRVASTKPNYPVVRFTPETLFEFL